MRTGCAFAIKTLQVTSVILLDLTKPSCRGERRGLGKLGRHALPIWPRLLRAYHRPLWELHDCE